MPRADLALALLLAGVTAASRAPFRARVLPTWDAIQFALALREYSIVKHQPHPPGYILYVAAGRAVQALVGDPAASLAWLSVAASAVAVGLLYRLAWMLDGRATALAAAILFAASPLFWLHGLVGLPYAAEAALVTLVAALAWRMRSGHAGSVYCSAAALALAGGVRQSLLVLLLPLWLGMAWAGVRRWRAVIGGCAVLALATAVWLVPMLWLAGGSGPYVAAALELYDSTVRATTVASPAGDWRGNLRGIVEASVVGLGVLLPSLVWLLGRGLAGGARWGAREGFLAGWVLPPLAVYAGVHFGQYAYLLAVLPALYLLVARSLVDAAAHLARRLGRPALGSVVAGSAVAVVVVAHGTYFLGAGPVDVPDLGAEAPWSARWAAELRALYRYRLWTSTLGGLREQEAVIASYVSAVRGEFDPRDTVLLTELGNGRSYPWFRHVRYYLPEFASYHLRLGGFSPGYLTSERPGSMAALAGPAVVLPAGARRLVWVVDYWNPRIARPPGLAERALPYGRRLYVLPLHGPAVAHDGYQLIRSRAEPTTAEGFAGSAAIS